MQRQLGAPPERPGLAEIRRVEFDQQALDGYLGALGNQTGDGGAGVDRERPGARALGEDQQMSAFAQRLAGAQDEVEWRVVGDIAGQTGRRTEQDVVHQRGLHDADHIRKSRSDHDDVQQ